jgi:hypothetical protein
MQHDVRDKMNIYHQVIIAEEPFRSACGRKEDYATRFEAEMRAAEFSGCSRIRASVQSVDDAGKEIEMPRSTKDQVLRLLYPAATSTCSHDLAPLESSDVFGV